MILPRFSACRIALPLLLVAAIPAVAVAEHAAIKLQVIGPAGQQEASADQEPPPGGVNPRPRLTVKSGDPLVLNFILTNVYPHGLLKDVNVRYFVVRTDKFDVKQLPKLTDGVVTQGMATFDFKPKCRVGARLRFRIDEPGIYLVRVETQNTKSDHEHFSAIDLEVK
jgi:hypothetical protein